MLFLQYVLCYFFALLRLLLLNCQNLYLRNVPKQYSARPMQMPDVLHRLRHSRNDWAAILSCFRFSLTSANDGFTWKETW